MFEQAELIEARKKFYYEIIHKCDYSIFRNGLSSYNDISFGNWSAVSQLEKCWHRDDIIPQPYQVHVSTEVNNILEQWNISTDSNICKRVQYYQNIKTKFAAGDIDDIRGNYLRHFKELRIGWSDHLFYFWGFRHIHISPNKKKPSKYILLIKLFADKVYFVDIRKHNKNGGVEYTEFYENRVWDIVNNNWSQDMSFLSLYSSNKYLTGANITKEERYQMFRCGGQFLEATDTGTMCNPDLYHWYKQHGYQMHEFNRNWQICYGTFFKDNLKSYLIKNDMQDFTEIKYLYYDISSNLSRQMLIVLHCQERSLYWCYLEYHPSMYYMLDRMKPILSAYFNIELVSKLLIKRSKNQSFSVGFFGVGR